MKKQDFLFIILVVVVFLPFFLSDAVYDWYKSFNAEHGMVMSFLKFAILSSLGEVLCGFLDVSLDGFVTYRFTQRGRFERVTLFLPFVIGCRIDNAVIRFAVHFPFHFLRLYIIYR